MSTWAQPRASGGLAGASKTSKISANSQFNKPPRTQKFRHSRKHNLVPDGGAQDATALAQLNAVFDDTNATMSDIQNRLESAQQAQRIGAPTVDDIKRLIEQAQLDAQKAKSVAEGAKAKNAGTVITAKGFASSQADDTMPSDVLRNLLELKGKMTTCAGSFGSAP